MRQQPCLLCLLSIPGKLAHTQCMCSLDTVYLPNACSLGSHLIIQYQVHDEDLAVLVHADAETLKLNSTMNVHEHI
jgi:hypothetical protein